MCDANDFKDYEKLNALQTLCGSDTYKGWHQENEDTAFMVPKTNGVEIYGVCDGHDGTEACNFVTTNLPLILNRELSQSQSTINLAIYRAIIQTDEEFCEHAKTTKCSSGTCLITAVIRGRHLTVASTGDCGALYADKDGDWSMICKRHVAVDEDERQRIKRAGGFVINGRAMGILEPSRTIGDLDVREHGRGLIAKPDVVSQLLPSSEELLRAHSVPFILLASDGVFDSMPGQRIYNCVRIELDKHKQNSKRCEKAARALVLQCATLTKDDVTAVVLSFDP